MSDIRDAAISVEVKLTGHAKRADGGLNIRFQVHPHGIPQQLRDAAIGGRYVLALVEVDDHDEPINREAETTPVTNTEERLDSIPANSEKPAPSPARAQHRLKTRAVLLCKEPKFHTYLRRRWAIRDCHDEAAAAKAVRMLCGVDSRSQFEPGTEAGERFESLLTDWTTWCEA